MAHRARGIGKSVHSAGQRALRELMISARKRAGLTQQDVAEQLEKPQSFVAKYENGERRLDVVEFLDICRTIGADAVRILRAVMRAQQP